MQGLMFSLISSLLLVLAVSIDSFAASFAYGTCKIKIPMVSVLIICGVSAAFLTISLFLGSVISPFLPSNLPKIISFIILLSIGIFKLFDGIVKNKIERKGKLRKKLSFSLFSLKFILNVYADPKLADYDSSKTLSPAESVSLAVALSLDGIAVGFGAALSQNDIFIIVSLAVILGVCAITLGGKLGEKTRKKFPINLSWVGGLILIVLAFFKL